MPGLLHADDLVLCGELEEDLRVVMGQFAEVCRRKLKVNAGMSKVMVLNGEEGLQCEVHLEYVLEYKHLRQVYESGIDGAECSRKVVSRRVVPGAIRSLVNARNLQLECARFAQDIACACSYVWQ